MSASLWTAVLFFAGSCCFMVGTIINLLGVIRG